MDDSLFDDENIHPEALAAAPVDAPAMDESLFDETPHPEVQDSAAQNAIEAFTGAGIGAGAGAVAPQLGGMALEKFGQGTQKLAETLSPYTPEQLSNMQVNMEQFNQIDPQETFEKAGGEFEKFNRLANQKEEDAYANMTEPLTRQEFEQTVSKSAMPYTKDVPTDTPEFLAAEQKLTPKINRPDPIKAQEAAQLEAFAEQQAQQRMADVKSANMGMMPEEQLLDTYRKTKQGLLKSKEGFGFVPDAKAAQAALDQESLDVENAAQMGRQGAIEKFQTPLAEKFPEMKGKMFKSAEAVNEGDIGKVLSQYAVGEKLTGDEPYKLVKKIRAMAYDKNDNLRISGETARAVQKQLRDLVGDKNPEASELLQSMSQDIKQIDRLEKAGYVKRDLDVSKGSDEFLNFGEKQQQNVLKDIAPNLYSNKVAISDDVAGRLVELKKVLPEPLFKEMELAALKQAMKSPKNQLNLSGFEVAFAAMRPAMASINIGKKALETAEGSLSAFRASKALQKAGQDLKKGSKKGAKVGGVLGGPLGAMASEVAQEALDVEPSGATPDMPDYYLERGVANPEEQVQKARLSSFKEGLPNQGQSQTPGPYDKPELQANRERIQQANKAEQGATSKKNYVEKQESTDANDIQGLINSFQGMGDRASQEYSNVLSQVLDAPDGKKEAILFGLNQQPAFREMLRRAKGKV